MFFTRCKLARFALPAPASALGVLLLAGCSGPQTPAAATAPTPADAAAFIAKAEEELRTVGEEAIIAALRSIVLQAKLVVEPAGAAGVAALASDSSIRRPVVAVLTGGNVDGQRLSSWLA